MSVPETTLPVPGAIAPVDMEDLARAHHFLEHPSLAARITNVVGTPVEASIRLLPEAWYDRLQRLAESSVDRALATAVASLGRRAEGPPRNGVHKTLGMVSGAAGGMFGLASWALEVPLITTIVLRSIADIAHSQGEDLADPEAQVACVQVFAFGARSHADDAAETGYYGVRLALALSVQHAVHHIARHGLKGEAAPVLVSLIQAISARFGVVLSQKAAMQTVPLIGALGGVTINTIFMQHFQDTAWGHFTVRRLERKYGEAVVRGAYTALGR